jgi:hypothetical protein
MDQCADKMYPCILSVAKWAERKKKSGDIETFESNGGYGYSWSQFSEEMGTTTTSSAKNSE